MKSLFGRYRKNKPAWLRYISSLVYHNIPFTEFNFYELYRRLSRRASSVNTKQELPLQEMAENFELANRRTRPKCERQTYFTSEGKVALMYLKMCIGLAV